MTILGISIMLTILYKILVPAKNSGKALKTKPNPGKVK